MVVHLATSKATLIEDIEYLRKIIKVVKKNHEFARDWIEPAYKEIKERGPKRKNVSRVYHQSVEEVAKADVLIAEVTHSSFGVGYQVASAIQQKKPTLLLSREGVNNDSLVKGLDDAVVRSAEYNDSNLEQIAEDFLDENNIQAKDLRFNFFIDRQIYNYLRWASFKTGKTKARILRELVLKEINKDSE